MASPMWGGGTASYTYDALDNLKRVVVPATLTGVARDHQYHYTANRLTSVTNTVGGATVIGLGYDVQGNLANKNGTLFAFDFGNRLRTAAGDTYRYDGHGRRIRVTGSSGTLFPFYGRDGQLFWLRDEPDMKRRQFVYLGGSLVAEYNLPIGGSTETVIYQHTDALGSPTVRTSQARAVLERSEFEPYGKLVNRANDDLPGHTGHVMDSGTGLTYMQQRYYDPGIGAFLSVDPVTAHSDPVGQFHRYRYANQNPYRFVDPDGRLTDRPERQARDSRSMSSHPGLGSSNITGVPSNEMGSQHGSSSAGRATTVASQSGVGEDSAEGEDHAPLYCSSGADCDFMYNQNQYLRGEITKDELLERTQSQGQSGVAGAAIAVVGVAAAEYGAATLAFARLGREISFGRNFRIAPFGNRTGNPYGRWPHYHRRVVGPDGVTRPGQGIGRHRPWEGRPLDRTLMDRF